MWKGSAGNWTATLTFIAGIVTSEGIAISDIYEWLKTLGFTDENVVIYMTATLIYDLVLGGEINIDELMDWIAAQVVAAYVAHMTGDAEAAFAAIAPVALIAQMTGVADSEEFVAGMASYYGFDEWTANMIQELFDTYTPAFAAGGIASGPLSGYPATLHGTELIIPLNGGIPFQSNTQAGAGREEEIALLKEEVSLMKIFITQNGRPIELGGKPLDDHPKRNAEDVNLQRISSRNFESAERFFQ